SAPSGATAVQRPCQWRWPPSALRRRSPSGWPSRPSADRNADVASTSISKRKGAQTASCPSKRSTTSPGIGASSWIRRACCDGTARAASASRAREGMSIWFSRQGDCDVRRALGHLHDVVESGQLLLGLVAGPGAPAAVTQQPDSDDDRGRKPPRGEGTRGTPDLAQ